MNTILSLLVGLLAFASSSVWAQTNDPALRAALREALRRPLVSVHTTNDLGLVTNGPTVTRLFRITQSWTNEQPVPPVLATNAAYLGRIQPPYTWTNSVFEMYRPESLNYAIWTNFIAHTNGRAVQIWSERAHPSNWPTNKPIVRWNTNNLMWGMRGVTALSPCWWGEGAPGQVPLTLLTRRHAYTRGHGIGPEGFHTHIAGYKAWFLTRDNVVVEAVVKRNVTRVSATNGVYRDYTIVLFDKDLPLTIDSMAVIFPAELQSKYRFPSGSNWPNPIFQTEQGGSVSAGIAPFVVSTWKGGDSGSPNMLPLPGELVFFSGRSTTGPTREMQEDMDELCRLERLDPKKYQLRRPDLSKYPSY
ncbi:MAG TPA: hypothetical protein VFZ59_24425 [Verrucomicrobiae bacterium]|nr:hypothetical protein [Verrucomicrobiae bacterium]